VPAGRLASINKPASTHHRIRPTGPYDLDGTLNSGQAFRWTKSAEGWVGFVGEHCVRLQPEGDRILATTAVPVEEWGWLEDYLQSSINLSRVIRTFPKDEPMQIAVASSRGLRLLRQPFWECLASFILSSNKQISHIRQIVSEVCRRFGNGIPAFGELGIAQSFPSPERIAALSESELRACGMGYRAPYLIGTARLYCETPWHADALSKVELADAQEQLADDRRDLVGRPPIAKQRRSFAA